MSIFSAFPSGGELHDRIGIFTAKKRRSFGCNAGKEDVSQEWFRVPVNCDLLKTDSVATSFALVLQSNQVP